jgi:hypothetical protein
MKISKKAIILIFIIFWILILTPLVFYIIKFGGNELSEKPENWSEFGNYFSGILNPIIALFGTVILGYLTYEVSRKNSVENLNLFFLEQKIIAYQKIANLTSEIDSAINKIKIHNDLMVKLGSIGNKEIAADQYIKAMETLHFSLSNFKIILENFPINYGHLFKYNFESEEYLKLKIRVGEYFISMDLLDDAKYDKIDFSEQELFTQFKSFLVELKKEI